MIPKIIHYCWFGGNPLPKSALKCIASWRKYFPGWEIKEWNESNYDVNIIPYTKQACDAKKYAFVSDYARFWILYNFGGVYFDTDVEVIRPFDEILGRGAFMGREAGAPGFGVNPGLGLGMEAGNEILKEILAAYADRSFLNPDGSLNTKTIVAYTTETLLGHGLTSNNDTVENVDGIWIYPTEYFCPMDHTRGKILCVTDRTVSIHHYDSSWTDHRTLRHKLHLLKNSLMRTFGPDRVQKIIDIFKPKQ